MGYAASWIALQNCTEQSVCELLELKPTGVTERFPKSKIVGAALSTGHYLLVFRGDRPRDKQFERLSINFGLIRGSVEEHVMFADVAQWAGGKLLWSIAYSGENGPTEELTIKGEPPSQLESIRRAQFAAQQEDEEADYFFEVPVILAEQLVGYRYDGSISFAEGESFIVLGPRRAKGFFSSIRKLFS